MTDTADLNRMLAEELARKQRQPVRSSFFGGVVPQVSVQDAAINRPDPVERASLFPFATYPDGSTKLALPGMIAEDIPRAFTAPARAYRGEIPDEDMISEGLNFAGNMAIGGSAVPKPSNAAGMFGGRLAKTSDHAKLQKAEKMAAEGAPREAIWRDTGWFQGVDGKWRFEIDDSGAAMKYPSGDVAGSVAKTMGVEGKMGDVFHHPKTYFAYPDVAAIDADIGMLRNGTYYVAPGPGGEKISVNAHHGERVPYTLHELQHSLQEREGFAKGGSIAGLRESLQGNVPDEWLTDKNLKELYRRMAGEVEARAVERRSSLTPLQRQDRAPWLDYDVPESQQVVRFNANASETAAPGALASEAARQPLPVKMEVPFYRGSAHGQTSVDYSQPYFGTTDRNLASDYAKSRSGMYFNADTTPNVVPAVGRFRNPLYIDAQNAGWSDIPFEGGKWNSDKLADLAKERGHDGLVIDRVYDEGKFDEAMGLPATVAALRPGTVSSAFDHNNILYANSKSSGVPGAMIAEAADWRVRNNPLPELPPIRSTQLPGVDSPPYVYEAKVPVNELHSGQPDVDMDYINRLVRGEQQPYTTDPINVSKVGGVSDVFDGNHRASAALLRGDERIPAYVEDYDLGGSEWNLDKKYGVRSWSDLYANSKSSGVPGVLMVEGGKK